MSEYDPYLAISLFGHLFPEIGKNAFPGLMIFKNNVLVLVSGVLIVNMHYAKVTLWTPKLQILVMADFYGEVGINSYCIYVKLL